MRSKKDAASEISSSRYLRIHFRISTRKLLLPVIVADRDQMRISQEVFPPVSPFLRYRMHTINVGKMYRRTRGNRKNLFARERDASRDCIGFPPVAAQPE